MEINPSNYWPSDCWFILKIFLGQEKKIIFIVDKTFNTSCVNINQAIDNIQSTIIYTFVMDFCQDIGVMFIR